MNSRSHDSTAGCPARSSRKSRRVTDIVIRRTALSGGLGEAESLALHLAFVGRPFQGRLGEAESLALHLAFVERPFQGRLGEAESLALHLAFVGRPFQGRLGEA